MRVARDARSRDAVFGVQVDLADDRDGGGASKLQVVTDLQVGRTMRTRAKCEFAPREELLRPATGTRGANRACTLSVVSRSRSRARRDKPSGPKQARPPPF